MEPLRFLSENRANWQQLPAPAQRTGLQLLGVLCSALLCVAAAVLPADVATFVQPTGWPQPAYNFQRNPLTPAGFRLGRRLFYDPALSRDSSTSCASCHAPAMAFTHGDHRLSHGIAGRIGTRNSPALMNLAWNTSFHWDGGVNNLEVQAVNPLTHPAEMDYRLDKLVGRLNGAPAYRARFARAFAGDSAVTGQHLLQALAQFTVTLQSFNSRYDKYVRQEPGGELSANELNGLHLFRQHCASCHQEPLFTNNGFANNGLRPDSLLNDLGRGHITGRAEDAYLFRVPTLRNVEFSGPYMHDGRFRSLRQAIQHYSSGALPASATLAPQLRQPLTLSPTEQRDLLLFLFTLSDQEFLRDPRWQYQPGD